MMLTATEYMVSTLRLPTFHPKSESSMFMLSDGCPCGFGRGNFIVMRMLEEYCV